MERHCTYNHQHDRTHLLSSVKRHNTHIHQHDRTHLLSSVERLNTYIHQHGRTHLLPFVERHNTYNHQHGRTHLLPFVKRNNTHIHQHDRTHLLSSMERLALTSTSMIGHTYYHLWKGSTLTSDHVGTHSSITLEWLLIPDWGFLLPHQVAPFQEWR